MVKNIKIGLRLSIGFGMLLLLLLAVGGYAIKEIRVLETDIDLLVNDRMVKVEWANSAIDSLNIIARVLRNLILDDNPEHQAEEYRRIEEARKNIRETLEKFNKTITTEKGKALLATIAKLRQEYIKHTNQMLEYVKAEQTLRARMLLLKEIREVQGAYIEAVEELIKMVTEEAKQEGDAAKDSATAATKLILILLVVALVLGATSAFFIIRSITGPVQQAADLAAVMAKGDFTAKLDIRQKDEIGAMAGALNTMAAQLSTMIRDIIGGVGSLSESSSSMAAVSRQLTSAAQDTAQKAAMVAAATEEMSTNIQSVSAAMEQSTSNVNMVASSAEEMTATVGEIAQNAEKARSISDGAVKQSQKASEKMALLGESARKIGRVTETITEISDQTNLLALNATIEAARAGEAGKGFAVVANEIKELAKQTAVATVDIKSQIADMQHTTATTVEDIQHISEIISEINSVISGIASAVEEQSAATTEIAGNISQASQGIGEVNENVAQSTVVIGDISRDIAAINNQSSQVGESANQVQASAQDLARLATHLESLVKQFTI